MIHVVEDQRSHEESRKQSHRDLRRAVEWERSMQDCLLEDPSVVRWMLNLQVRQAAIWLAKGSCGLMGLLEVLS